MAKLTDIEGIGPVLSDKLQQAGVSNIARLLAVGGPKRGRRELAARTGLTEGRLLKLVNCADLMRIKGVGGEYAELLEAAGVDSVPELARRNAANLTRQMASVNARRKLVRLLPSEKRVISWVAQAGRLPKAVHH